MSRPEKHFSTDEISCNCIISNTIMILLDSRGENVDKKKQVWMTKIIETYLQNCEMIIERKRKKPLDYRYFETYNSDSLLIKRIKTKLCIVHIYIYIYITFVCVTFTHTQFFFIFFSPEPSYLLSKETINTAISASSTSI